MCAAWSAWRNYLIFSMQCYTIMGHGKEVEARVAFIYCCMTHTSHTLFVTNLHHALS